MFRKGVGNIRWSMEPHGKSSDYKEHINYSRERNLFHLANSMLLICKVGTDDQTSVKNFKNAMLARAQTKFGPKGSPIHHQSA
jgi:hypothetical protein